MARRKEAGHGGGHGWFVTFADLMGLLVAFFVMLVAFSTQDQKKLQIVAGSMREAFGVQTDVRLSGVVEGNGLPSRPKLKNVTSKPEDASDTPTPEDRDQRRNYGTRAEQAKDGLNIEIVDQDGRSMFPEGGKEPYERTRRLIQKLAGQLKALPNRITVTGRTAATRL